MHNKHFHLSFKGDRWPVFKTDWCGALELWVLYGILPGSFLTAVLRNDLTDAVMRSHPANSWESISQVVKWLYHMAPSECYGSLETLESWHNLTNEQRMEKCIECGLMPSPWELLQDLEKWNTDNVKFI